MSAAASTPLVSMHRRPAAQDPCSSLCRLQYQCMHGAGVDRLSFSVIWDMARDGTILRQWAGRSVICTAAKLAYQHAEAMIVGDSAAWTPPEGVALKAPHTWEQVRACSHSSASCCFVVLAAAVPQDRGVRSMTCCCAHSNGQSQTFSWVVWCWRHVSKLWG